MSTRKHQLILLGAAALLGFALAAGPALADMREDTPPPNAPKPSGDRKDEKKKVPLSGEEFTAGYKAAYTLIKSERYADGIAGMQALGQDDHTDVATSIGFAWRKLGDYDNAKLWYDRALKADPANITTLSYYGMWHAEQGNVLKAEDFLQTINVICGGTECEPYKNLKGMLEGKFTY
jgi:tetratricopeptide (TPR) repeat protein